MQDAKKTPSSKDKEIPVDSVGSKKPSDSKVPSALKTKEPVSQFVCSDEYCRRRSMHWDKIISVQDLYAEIRVLFTASISMIQRTI